MFDFSSTQWNMIDLAGGSRPAEPEEQTLWEEAWEHLIRKYRRAFEFAARDSLRRFGAGALRPDQAGDVVQGFLVSCIEKRWLERAAPKFGRFRAFVFTLLRRYTLKQVEFARAQKRHPVGGHVPLQDLLSVEEPVGVTLADHGALDEWVGCVVDASKERVRRRSPHNAIALDLVLRHEGRSNLELARYLGWSASRFTLARHRGLRMLQEEIRNEVGETVRDARTHAAELQLLMPYIGTRTAQYEEC